MTSWTDGEREAFVEHLQESAAAVEAHVRGGGTLDAYAAEWKTRRDEAAAGTQVSAEVADRILGLAVPRWDDKATVREYLAALLDGVWKAEAGGKYGITGDSDWRYDVYEPLNQAGLIRGWREGYGVGYREGGRQAVFFPEDAKRADALVASAIRRMAGL